MTAACTNRRHFLTRSTRLVTAGIALPFAAGSLAHASESTPVASTAPLAGVPGRRSLAFNHAHTRERLSLVYAVDGDFLPESLSLLNRFLRDHYSGAVGQMDPQLFDVLHQIRLALGSASLPAYEVISGYRCPETNLHLRNSRGGGVARRSLHTEGKAIDVRLPGVPLAELRDAARSLQAGGVGYYPHEQFVHIDTGRVRRWG